jgi:putative ATP-binding cassette transporter
MKKSIFNFSFFSHFWAIAKLYWLGQEKWGALALLLTLFLFMFIGTQFNVILNTEEGEIISALAKLDINRFWQTIAVIIGIQMFLLPMWALSSYVRAKLSLYWRRWLSTYFIEQYFQNRSFYKLSNFHSEIDNPDQRIAEDIKYFTDESVS